jgi:DNA-binding CsgD family transcriptional regulator
MAGSPYTVHRPHPAAAHQAPLPWLGSPLGYPVPPTKVSRDVSGSNEVPRRVETPMMDSQLVGRDRELGMVEALVEQAQAGGGALVVRGEAGIGKSALLACARQRARERGMTVLSASGVQSEAHLPFAGLHQLLRPVWSGLDDLPAPQRTAVLAAFGMADAAPLDAFLIALAVLNLLSETATRAPLLILIEDAHWVDSSTHTVLAFVARRLAAEPIVLLFAARDGFDNPLDQTDLPELRLDRLSEAEANTLLDTRAPGLLPAVRQRVLEAAAGNPLALTELPLALAGEQRDSQASLPAWLPLTTRLERTFAARMTDLPAASRTLLLVAAADDGSAITEILSATDSLLGRSDSTAEALQPAIDAGLIVVDDLDVRFRHPLMRSAVYQAGRSSQRRAAHAALATVLADQRDRYAWHRAASSFGPDEEVAVDLEAAAARAQRRGAIGVALAAIDRAITVSGDRGDRAGRLLRAAELAVEVGQQDLVVQYLRKAEPLVRTILHQGRVAWIKEMVDPGPPGDAVAVQVLVDTAHRTRAAGDTDLAVRLLLAAATRCTYADPGDAAREAVVTAAEQAGLPADDPRLLAVLVSASPIGRNEVVLARLARAALDPDGDPYAMYAVGDAAGIAGAYDLAARWHAAAISGLRTQGRLVQLAQALVSYAWAEAQLGRCTAAMPAAAEGSRLAQETGQLFWFARGRATGAILAALHGDHEGAASLAEEVERVAGPTRIITPLASARLARGLSALGAGQYAVAYDYLQSLFDPTNPASSYARRSSAIGDLAEAALHSGHRDEARALIADLEQHVALTRSPWAHIGMRYARALLADDDDAEVLFRAALAADVTAWPLARARLQLAFGAWLRRQRRVAESRPYLRAARDAFDALGAAGWSERARQELRAAGETSRQRAPDALDLLTPQELQIAQLAADGLSNREIGQRLYLSHRTVGSHLYHIFPKLGISQRSELRDALDTGIRMGTQSLT